MMWIKFGVIWLYRLQDYNVLVLKKDAEIFLATHLEVKFDFYTYSNKKLQTMKCSKQGYKYIGERKYHSIDSLCLQSRFKISKNSKKSCKKHI